VFKDQMPFKIKIYPGNTDCVLQYVDASAAHAAPGFFNGHELKGEPTTPDDTPIAPLFSLCVPCADEAGGAYDAPPLHINKSEGTCTRRRSSGNATLLSLELKNGNEPTSQLKPVPRHRSTHPYLSTHAHARTHTALSI